MVKLNSLYTTSLARPEELQAKCAQLQSYVGRSASWQLCPACQYLLWLELLLRKEGL